MKTLRKRTTRTACLFLIVSIVLVTVYMMRREYAATDTSERVLTPVSSSADGNALSSNSFDIQKELIVTESPALDALSIYVPLPENTHFENLTFENHYPEHTLTIRIRQADPTFFNTCEVIAAEGLVTSAVFRYDESEKAITLLFTTDGMYEFFPEYKSQTAAPDISRATPFVTVICHSPKELYDNIIVIDPVLTTSQGATDAALILASEMQALAEETDKSTRIYLTRTDQTVLDPDLILKLVRESGASKYLSLALPEGIVSLRASAYFNDRFYIRDYGNLQLAADAEQALSVLDEITLTGVYPTESDPGNSLPQSSETVVLNALKIPGTMLRIDGLRAGSEEDQTQISLVAAALLKIF